MSALDLLNMRITRAEDAILAELKRLSDETGLKVTEVRLVPLPDAPGMEAHGIDRVQLRTYIPRNR